MELICLPPAGTGTADYRGWTELLPFPVRPVVLPGRERLLSTPPHRSMHALVEWLLPQIPDDYAVYGHSFGAWVAFELAHLKPPRHLFVGARRAPHLPSTLSAIGHLDDRAFVDEVNRRYDAIPERLLDRPEILALFLPALRADFEILETYTCAERGPLDVPITAFRGLSDPTVQRSEVASWREHTRADFALRQLPGGHFFQRDAAELLCDAIAGTLRYR